jgi:hypothetical protein
MTGKVRLLDRKLSGPQIRYRCSGEKENPLICRDSSHSLPFGRLSLYLFIYLFIYSLFNDAFSVT